MTSEATSCKEINETGININEPLGFEQDMQEKPNDDGVENKSSSIPEGTTQPLVKPQQSSIPFPNRVRKEKDPGSHTTPCQVLEKHKETEDLAANHSSRIENPHMEVLTEREITDEFFDEHLMVLKSKSSNDEP
ncbi:hypothetical protein Tco_1047198, partial [Tanacetum coccineum]